MKRYCLKTHLILILASMLVLTPLAHAAIQSYNPQTYDQSSSMSLNHSVTYAVEDLRFSEILEYDMISLSDGYYLSEPGKPLLPTSIIKLAVPQGMQAEQIVVLSEEHTELPGSFSVIPGQYPLTMDDTPADMEFVNLNSMTYNSYEPYPGELVRILDQSDLAGQALVELEIAPVQYVPATQKLVLYTDITFEVTGSYGYQYGDYLPQELSAAASRQLQKRVRSLVDNPDQVTLHNSQQPYKPVDLPPDGPYDHVIITADSYVTYYQPLVEWNSQKGYRDTVVTTNYIYNNYPGANNQEKIQNFIEDAYTTWGTLYFLLGGEHSTVPFKYRTVHVEDHDPESIPGDMYYGDFDGDWEIEVYVGRVTAEGSDQITRFVDKVLTYEQNPPLTNYVLDTVLLGMDLTVASDPPYYTLTAGEEVKELIDDYYIPSRFNVIEVYDSEPTNHRVEFLNALDDGQNLVNHNDHSNYYVLGAGDRNHNSYVTIGDVSDLSNTNRLSNIFSVGCHANELDHDDCIGEHFVIYNDDTAAVSFTGNTRSGWFYVGDPDSLTARLDRYWWRALFDQDIFRLGEMLAWSKNANPTSPEVWEYCQWTLNLLGEPLMPVWTDTPGSFSVTHPSEVPTGLSDILVHVEDAQGYDVADAYVCAYKNGEVFETGYTDNYGDIVLSVAPLTVGEMTVTVTKHNYIPYSADVTAELGATYPFLPRDPTPIDELQYLRDFEQDISWTGGDPQGDTVTYDIYFGSTPSPPLVASAVLGNSYEPGELSYDTQYYWKIVADDNNGSVTYGPMWTFSTIAQNHMYIEDSVAQVGETGAVVQITGSWDQPIKAYQMYVSYDTSSLEFWKVDFSETIGSNADYALGNEMEPGMLSLGAVWFTAGYPDAAGSGLLADILFNVTTDTPGDVQLSITYYNGNPSVFTDESGFSVYPDDLVGGVLTISDIMCGDANGDGVINVSDAVFVINYVFIPGSPEPDPVCIADANGDGTINVSDAVYLINYVFIPGSPPPVTDCCVS